MVPAAALAQGTATDDGHEPGHAGDDAIIVTGHPPIDFGLLASSASLEGDSLIAQGRGQIGEMLARLPGVSATSFAPGVSRPVLRGFDGDRIRVLTDGIGSIDASSVSADHAVVFDALTIDHIDVMHGPSVLLFGGQAIGGAVNALDKRIPRTVPDGITFDAIGAYGTAADERSLGAAVDVALAPRLVAHLDANWRKSGNLRTGGFIASPALRRDLIEDANGHLAKDEIEEAGELIEAAGRRGRLANSATEATTLGAGIAFIDDGGNIGVSVQRYDTRYGVPLRPGAGHGHGADEEEEDGEHGEESVAIDLVQTRVDLRGAVEIGGLFESLQFRGAYGDYRHIELENGEPGTRFAGDGIEFRADLIQAERGGWRGRSGVQTFDRKLSIVGSEAFVPSNRIARTGLFTLQSVKLGAGFEAEGALRYERASVTAQGVGFRRGFNLWSYAGGLSWRPVDGLKIGVNYTRGARAPAPEELLSDGAHIATQSYEIGDPTFGVERSDGYEAYLHYGDARTDLSLALYRTDFDSFIAALPSGEVEDDLPVFRYAQLPARFQGFEASLRRELVRWDGGKLEIEGAADYTRARLKNAGPVPRIPPLRLRGGLGLTLGTLRLHGEAEWNAAQKRVATFENPVPGFTLVNLSADWHPLGEDKPLTLMLSANNLLDVTARRAASFTRDFVPLPGRDVRVTAKVSF